MENFHYTTEYFLEISQKCRYNETMAEWYERMADMQFDAFFPLGQRDEDLGEFRHSVEYSKMNCYTGRAERMRLCMRTGWLSDWYRLSAVKVVKSVNRCRDRFCYNCQAMDSLQRFHENVPVIDKFSEKFEIYHCVFSQPNVPGFLLSQTLDLMYKSFSKFIGYMSGKKKIRGLDLAGMYGFEGAVRALEVSQNDKDRNYHPHFHCLLILRKGIDNTPRHRNMFSKDHTHRREDRLFSDFEVFLQRIWYLLMNGIRVTKKNLEELPQIMGKQYPDGFSCYAEPAEGHYHECFKYATKGSYSNGSILNDFECFLTLYKALYRRRVYQTYGCLYGIDMNELREEEFRPGDLSDACFNELLEALQKREEPVAVVESLTDILREKIPNEDKRGVRYISLQSIRYAFDECEPSERQKLKDRIVMLIWNVI